MHIGLWLPVFGGWLRNLPDEGAAPTFADNRRVAQAADRLGFSTLLVAELNLNDIRGPQAPSLEAWTTAAALAPLTEQIRLMAAVRPGFRLPAVVAKMAANIDRISGGRFEVNLVSAWWKEEMEMYVGQWLDHAERYRRSAEFADVLKGTWTQETFNFEGDFYTAKNTKLEPKPVQTGGVPIYAGGGSDEGRAMIAHHCDHYLTHGSTPDEVRAVVEDMKRRRAEAGFDPAAMQFGMAAFMICRDTDEAAQEELARITAPPDPGSPAYHSYKDFVEHSKSDVTPAEYAVSNRGLRPGLVGTPEQIAERLAAFETAGLDLVLAQCSPMLEEVERIGAEVLPLVQAKAAPQP